MMEEVTETLDGEITGIKFALASHQEICKASVNECPIGHSSQLTNPFLGLPLESGKCESCGTAEPQKCEGHFGFIELPLPIYHPSHVAELKRLLSLLCLKCLKCKNKFSTKSSGSLEKLLSSCCEEISNITVKDSTNGDGACSIQLKSRGRSKVPEGFWSFLDKYGFHYGEGFSRTLLPLEVLAILKKLPDETKRKLVKKGYFPQEGYIMRLLPVPPNCLSIPDVSDGVSVLSMDLASSMLKKVLRQIEIIKSTRSGEPNFESHEVETNDLQVAVLQYLQVRGAGTASNEPGNKFGVNKEAGKTATKAWLEKIRTLFISKGSGFSSRTVITGESYKNVNEVGLPLEIAQRITFEEKVNVYNINILQSLVDNNLCLSYKDGASSYSLREGSKGHTFLRPGQVVHRRIMDGDVVFINRPPTTHKHSLQALRIYVHEDHTVKINPLMCGPFGADFDGDCVHLFYPQSLDARAEVIELFSVEKQLLSSHTGNLNLQLATDALLSLKMMFKAYFLGKLSAQQLSMFARNPLPPPALQKSRASDPYWTALQVIQSTLPSQFDCYGDRHMIRKSEILKIDFNKDIMKSMLNEIVTSIVFEKGANEALNFFDSLQPLLMENIFSEGFSVGLEDFIIPSSVIGDIQRQIQDISSLLFQLRSSYNEFIARQMDSYLRRLKRPVDTFVQTSSSMGSLIDSRSDLAMNKIVQQIGFIGLQLYDRGKFYSKELVGDMARLFHKRYPYRDEFPCGEYGLVKSAFFNGLDPYEEMVHSIATREVIIRSSRGLAEPGTLFKNLMAILRDVVICYDGTVRNVSSNSIIQFDYGVQGEKSQSLFPAGEPVGVLAATAMSNPAYKAVLDSSPSSNSSWYMMKEILFCHVNFRNDLLDRRVILYLNACECGRKFCRENASCVVKTLLKKVSLRDAAVEFLIEYKSPGVSSEYELDKGLVGHIHLSKVLLNDSNIGMHDILEKCQDEVNNFRKKKQFAQFFKGILLSVSECCSFCQGSKWSDMPCLKFFWQDNINLDRTSRVMHIMADVICPILLDTVVKGDPRIAAVNVIWINPDTSTWIGNSSDRQIGELAVEVVLEKKAVKRSGDAWRIVMDCCLAVFRLIDTRRSIPYAVKQIQELLGISCAFDQAVQRLSTSVTVVEKEATLYTPRKCFERAAEKCHLDSLSSIVASCSWGKRVAVGTGARFDILWNGNETTSQKSGIDVYDFLQLVRNTRVEEEDVGCLGVDVDKFGMEDEYMEEDMSPKGDSKAVFEDGEVEVDNADGWEGGAWNSGNEKQDTNSVWGSKSGGWDSKTSEPEQTAWGSASDSLAPPGSGGWGAANEIGKSTQGHTANEGAFGWNQSGECGSKKTVPETSSAWDSVSKGDNEQGAWGSASDSLAPTSSEGWGAANEIGKSTQGHTANEGAFGWNQSGEWGSKKIVPETSSAWGSVSKGDNDDASGWGSKKNNPEASNTWGVSNKLPKISEGWGSQSESGKSAAAASGGKQSGGWGSKENASETSNAWGSRKEFSSPLSSNVWGSASAGNSGGWSSKKDNIETSNIWGAPTNTNEKVETSSTWGSSKEVSPPTGSQGWGSANEGNNTAPSGSSNWNTTDNSHEKSGWGSMNVAKSEAEKESSWVSPSQTDNGDALGWGSLANEKSAPSDSQGWDAKISGTEANASVDAQSQWGKPSASSSSDQWQEAANSQGWGALKSDNGGENGTQSPSPWGQAGGSTWKKKGPSTPWGSSDTSDWKNRQNRPARPPRPSDGSRNNMYTDGDPISAEDQSYIVDHVLAHHPDKDAKVGGGMDHIMGSCDEETRLQKIGNRFEYELHLVSKHTNFQDSRCMYVVSIDGQKQDFSYRKCMENLVKKKYPDLAESFFSKYWRRPRNAGDNEQGPKNAGDREQEPKNGGSEQEPKNGGSEQEPNSGGGSEQESNNGGGSEQEPNSGGGNEQEPNNGGDA
ncbi:hypothetical protein V2J09_012723 [Rumex salicifolius]